MGSGKKYREGNYSYYYMYIYLYVGFHWPVWSVSTQFPSLQDAPDLGWDYKFVDNVTDLLTWVHVKGRNTSSYTAPDPRMSQHTGNIIGYGSFLCLPCLPTPPSTPDQPQHWLQHCFPRPPPPHPSLCVTPSLAAPQTFWEERQFCPAGE